MSPCPLVSVRREANERSSTFESEVVTCEFADRTQRRLLLKYAALLDGDHRGYGMTSGPAYEALVYSKLLRNRIRPAFYGFQSSRNGVQWIALEFIQGAVLLRHAQDEDAFLRAAAWLGRFHAAQEQRLASSRPAGIRVYDVEFFRGWVRRTREFAGAWCQSDPWLTNLGANFDSVIEALVESAPTLVHGDFYAQNILYRGGEIFPVDWETAAIGAGEIDLVAFSEGWPEADVRRFAGEYRAARWPAEPPALFERALAAAHIFTHVRWMGDHPGWTSDQDEVQWRLAGLQQWAARFAEAAP